LDKNIENFQTKDDVLKELNQSINNLKVEIETKKNRHVIVTRELNNIEDDLMDILQQLKEVTKKEAELEKEAHDIQKQLSTPSGYDD